MPSFLVAIITTIHVLGCIALTVSILLQAGKGGGLAGAFGGGGASQTLFGGRGAAGFLGRATTVLAVVFFLTSLTLGLSQTRNATTGGSSLIQEEARRRAGQRAGTTAQPAPGTPAPQAPADGAAPAAPSAGGEATPPTPAPGSGQ